MDVERSIMFRDYSEPFKNQRHTPHMKPSQGSFMTFQFHLLPKCSDTKPCIKLASYCLVCRGTFDIYVKIDGADKKVGCYDNKGSFGELALMYNLPRAATIVATSAGSCWAMVSFNHNILACDMCFTLSPLILITAKYF